jgi:hypothetical protein
MATTSAEGVAEKVEKTTTTITTVQSDVGNEDDVEEEVTKITTSRVKGKKL